MAPQLVTDPELLRQLNAPDSPSAPAPATPSPSAAPAAPAGMTRVTDPELLRQLNAPDEVAGVRFRDDGSPTDIVNKPTAANDPIYHGAVPVGQAPPDPGAVTAFASGVQGAPIVGPSISSGVEAAAAAGRSLRDGTSYADERQRVQEMVDLARSQHPGAAFAGDLTGAASATAPLIAFAPEAFGAGSGGLTLGKVGAGALSGAGIGGVDAAVRSGGDVGSIEKGLVGGAIGGGGAPIFAAGLSRAAGGASDYLARITGGNVPGISSEAASTIMRALENDGALSPQGVARLQEAGPQGTLADVGPATAGALDTALARGGPGSAAARAAIEQRAADSSRDLSATLDRTLGPAPGLQTAGDAIRDSSAAARRAAYDAAYAAPIDYTTDAGRALEDIVANRVPPRHHRAGQQPDADGRHAVAADDSARER